MHDAQAVLTFAGGGADLREPAMMSDRRGHNGITDDGTATTLTAQEKERPVVGASIVRRLTPLECERLQGFPDNYKFVGGKQSKNLQIGNAVPPILGEAIATVVRKALKHEEA